MYHTTGDKCGVVVSCPKKCVWNTVVNLIASVYFGADFWDKKNAFLDPNPVSRNQRLSSVALGDNYFKHRLAH
jgi:hypothetical protein